MGIPLHDFKVRLQRRQIQRGGRLAHAAADFVHRLPIDIGRGGQIAPSGGPLAHHQIIVENIAAVQNCSVDRGGGQLHIADACGSAAHVGGVGAQHIPKQNGGQLFRRHGGKLHVGGNFHRVARLGGIHRGLGQRHVKVRAHPLGRNRAGGGVVSGVFHVTGGLVVNLLGGYRPGGLGKIGNVQRKVQIPRAALDALGKRLGVHGAAVLGHVHQNRSITQFVSGVLAGKGKKLRGGLRGGLRLFLVQRDQARRVGKCARVGEIPPAQSEKIAPQISLMGVAGHGGSGNLRSQIRQSHIGVRHRSALRNLGRRVIVKIEADFHSREGPLQLLRGLSHRQPAQVLPQNQSVFPKQAVVRGIGAKADISCRENAQQHKGNGERQLQLFFLRFLHHYSIHGFLPVLSELKQKRPSGSQYSTFLEK
ncbi:hypothetical protein SDC9_95691 [bioreactor metagenome]|uniref:Uncharacterized protein n=1 Tax=bioreactor metagenome TaxID=1076179 RepID=A0A645AH38_9ZZZZ